ncbi:MAG: methyl-accepting chemotaxis protein [Pseudomonadota bacterium]
MSSEDHSDRDVSPPLTGVPLAFGALCLMTVIPPLSAIYAENPVLGPLIFCVGVTGTAWLVMRFAPVLAKLGLALALVLQAMAFSAAFAGHPWQIDTHMMYFAILAVIAVMQDQRALLLGAAAIAGHHVLMSAAMPEMIYPESGESVVGRTILHAAIVVMQTAVLFLSIRASQRADAEIKAQQAELKASSAASRAAEARAAEEREAATDTVVQLGQALKRLADHDLSGQMETPLEAQFEPLRRDLNDMIAQFREVFQTVQTTAFDYDKSAQELASTSEALAVQTERQAGTLSSVAEGLQALTETVRETAAGAAEANTAASEARDSASENSEIVAQAVAAMERIEGGSAEISKIIELIDDIAFQTNLLALNAGVEAARAGEAGRGFAVVASEVRALAQRTAEAAQNVKSLIGNSSVEIGSGAKLVNQAGASLSVIADQVKNASGLIDRIAASIAQQSNMVQELNSSVSSLDQATQNNAAVSEEMTAMGQHLASGSHTLKDAVSSFKLQATQPAQRMSMAS